jgi:hypothetical protein
MMEARRSASWLLSGRGIDWRLTIAGAKVALTLVCVVTVVARAAAGRGKVLQTHRTSARLLSYYAPCGYFMSKDRGIGRHWWKHAEYMSAR